MKKRWKQICAFILSSVMLSIAGISAYAQENCVEHYATYNVNIEGKNMHTVLYGDVIQTDTGASFADNNKTTLVMLPALAVPSPHLYYKPLAQELDSEFNVVIIEPLGYGLSDKADTDRSVENINKELEEALEALDIEECVLLVHSISGVYGLNFVLEHPEKVKGFVAIDNTIYEDEIQSELAMEQEYMLSEAIKFDELRKSYPSDEEFRAAISSDPEQYGATLPEITGYNYTENDMEEYIEAYSRSFNESIINEISQMDQSVLTIKGKKFPNSLPVLMMISATNVENVPVWETGHRNQLNLQSSDHELYVLEGSHYIWYTNLSGVLGHISEWKTDDQF